MQQPIRTVIYGEAPEESDSEEVELNDERTSSSTSRQHQPNAQHTSARAQGVTEVKNNCVPTRSSSQQATNTQQTKNNGGIFGTSLFASITGSSSSALAKLAKYSPYELLGSSIGQPNLLTTVNKNDHLSTYMKDSLTTSPLNDGDMDQLRSLLSPLHKTLYTKNCQFRASMNHLYKHPLQVTTKSVHSMSQCLVNDQKIIQEVSNELIKIERERKNFDIGIPKIV
jgi:hypothetical protein